MPTVSGTLDCPGGAVKKRATVRWSPRESAQTRRGDLRRNGDGNGASRSLASRVQLLTAASASPGLVAERMRRASLLALSETDRAHIKARAMVLERGAALCLPRRVADCLTTHTSRSYPEGQTPENEFHPNRMAGEEKRPGMGGLMSTIAVLIPVLFSYGRAPGFMDFFMWGVAVALVIGVAVWLVRNSGTR